MTSIELEVKKPLPAFWPAVVGTIRRVSAWLFSPSQHPRQAQTQSLSIVNARRSMRSSRPCDLSRLYVMHVDYEVTERQAVQLDAVLEPLRQKYGIDFLVLEPGNKLSRFEDI